jgi:hypothetical protein
MYVNLFEYRPLILSILLKKKIEKIEFSIRYDSTIFAYVHLKWLKIKVPGALALSRLAMWPIVSKVPLSVRCSGVVAFSMIATGVLLGKPYKLCTDISIHTLMKYIFICNVDNRILFT